MDEKLKQVKEIVKEYNQEQLLKAYDRIEDPKQKQEFLDSILTIDFKRIKEMYEERNEKPSFTDSKIEPIDYIDKSKMSEEDYLLKIEEKNHEAY